VLASGGMQADGNCLRKVLKIKVSQYKHTHKRVISAPSIAQMLSNTLYYKRFFPYYAFNVLGGVDKDGVGGVWGYDAIGSFERVPYVVTGSGSTLITSVLDNQVCFKTHPQHKRDLSAAETVDLIKDCFTVACERDIYTGDQVLIHIITAEGTKVEVFNLKKD
jgi:20S proteasome subunit beta 6